MSHQEPAPEGKDPILWEIARKRASFKGHLITYLVVNGFFWALWYLTGERYGNNDTFPWPVWPMFGWGIGLAFHFAGAYIYPESNSVENEYRKLKERQNK